MSFLSEVVTSYTLGLAVGSLSSRWTPLSWMGTPLLAFALVSQPWRDRVLGLLAGNRRLVNAATGAVLLAISEYYLRLVFEVLGAV